MDVLDRFSPATRDWFTGAFAGATPAQAGAWEAVAEGQHALVVAPTGSGKTLAAFLWALDRLATTPPPDEPTRRCRVLYVSPMKALTVDVQRNLRSPLAGLGQAAQRLGLPRPDVTVGSRTGDTPADERRTFNRTPPDILVTTPESLFLLLTSAARESLRGVDTVIVDEVHAVLASKRGAHLALSLERLDALLDAPAQRIGLSATVRPIDEVAAFLGGGRPVRVVAPETAKTVQVRVEVPVEDMSALDAGDNQSGPGVEEEVEGSAAGAAQRASIWPAVQERILELVGEHRSTIVFANSRRLAERLTARINELATERAHAAAAHQAPVELDADVDDAADDADDADADRTEGPTDDEADELAPVVGPFPAEAVGQSGTAEPAEVIVARAHHGSMSRTQRTNVEEALKSGHLPCVVATSSLELGIDMGAVDLVIQVEAPPSVASGLQRVGRAGHQVGAVSTGVVMPKYRGDLVSCAVVAERMAGGAIEAMHYPRNPLDVLAQHVVAMTAMEPWSVDELTALVRRAAPFAGLPDSALGAVLDMLAGRYPSEDFGELRPRITWDRVTDQLAGRPGAQRLAVTSGGTIPDRGLYTVVTPGSGEGGTGGSRVGELDEEMVYESRVGDTFLLGSTSWRVLDITRDRVVAEPAPGVPARMPFWKGDAPGRPLELGRALGAFVREVAAADEEAARGRAQAAGLDDWAADNLRAYLREQKEATRHVPSDRAIVVERFRDELGDWRLVVHSPFGAQVNAPWALAIAARFREQRGLEVSAASADDGIVLRLPDALDDSGEEVLPTAEDVLLDPDEVEQIVTGEVSNSALFAARFRECAARSLLLPRRDPTRRTPLWQQRQRAAQLLSVASRFEQFPVVLETMREVLQDVYDVPGLTELMRDVRSRAVQVVDVATASASPFARTLMFGYVGMFLYELDAPLAERRAAALSLDSTLLAELLGSEAIRELLDADVLAEIEGQLQRTDPERHVRDAEGTADLLRFVGDLTTDEAAARGVQEAWLTELEAARRAIRVRVAGEERWIAIEDAGRFRDALGAGLPVGVPEAFTEPVPDPLGDLLARFARTRGPFPVAAPAHRFGLGVAVVGGVIDRLVSSGRLVRGELRPDGAPPLPGVPAGLPASGPDACDAEVLRRLRRGSLARLRAEVEPVEPAALGRFLPAWHGIGGGTQRSGAAARTANHGRLRRAPGPDDVLGVVEQLAGAPIPASALESLVLPARLPGYSPALLDELTSAGEVTWTGCGTLAGGDGWLAVAPTDLADLLLPDPEPDLADTPVHRALLETLEAGGALFFRQLGERTHAVLRAAGGSETSREIDLPDDATLVAALWDLVWAGLATNDTLAPVRALVSGGGSRGSGGSRGGAHRQRRTASRGRYARLGRAPMPSRTGPPTAAGRWSGVPAREAEPTRRAQARTEAFLERHGVLTRGALDTERATGGFAGIYPVLRAMEENGRARRGYVIEGLGAAQFAVPGAIDRLRAESRDEDAGGEPKALVLAATDPAQPWGAALEWPATVGSQDGGTSSHRPGRKAGALVVLVDGEPGIYVERGGKSVLSFTTDREALAAGASALATAVREGWLGSIAVEKADGSGALDGVLAEVLTEAGFRHSPKGLRLRA
ncbi:ATP-dependent helicase [Actinomycetospora lemnae]|uniref:ATP-dependent helicase n=1 Tax=Actinomycetospora lemnae TaxID=3019891 RepID=A0ABT5SMZ5_9PSEU|nr:ATP-dependent helicase [Actinomycetospora sp. DW7H6]MDD7964215.1 ATP-dependent helicase [Actinomycetospora sp. DW7H6]